jgi:membrane-associated phospholipid phosphatase
LGRLLGNTSVNIPHFTAQAHRLFGTWRARCWMWASLIGVLRTPMRCPHLPPLSPGFRDRIPCSYKANELTQMKSSHQFRKFLGLGGAVVGLAGYITLAFFASRIPYFPIDLTITRCFQTFHPYWFVVLLEAASWAGYPPQAVIISVVLIVMIWVMRRHWEAVVSAATSLGLELLDFVTKVTVRRPRPPADLVMVSRKLTSFSFPSGHVTFYTGFFGFLLYLSYHLLKPSWQRTLIMLFFGSLIVLVGPSRVYLGEHWFSDVVGGYILGGLGLAAAIRVYWWGRGKWK